MESSVSFPFPAALPSGTAALYIRVSTHEQEELSPDSQKRLLLNYARAHNMIVPEEFIYLEHGISGRKAAKRPAFQKMIADAKSPAHPFDLILVWKYSRFARNQEESIVYKSMLRSKCQVEVVSISEPLMDGPFGSLIERIIEWMDEFYSIRLSGDVKRGMTERALRGGCQCRPPFGYRVPFPHAIPAIVPEEADIVRLIFEKYAVEHFSLSSLTALLNQMALKTSRGNPFEKRSVKYILSNPFYAGFVRWNRRNSASNTVREEKEWILEPGTHPPIISQELFSMARDRLGKEEKTESGRKQKQEPARHWLSGLVKCPACNSSLSSCIRHRKTMADTCYFQCTGYLKGKCSHNSYISEAVLVSAVLKSFQEISGLGRSFSWRRKPLPPSSPSTELSVLHSSLGRLKLREQRAAAAYLEGIDSAEEYALHKKLFSQEKDWLIKRISCLEQKISFENQPSPFSSPSGLPGLLLSSEISNEEKNAALKCAVRKIVYHKESDQIDICYY